MVTQRLQPLQQYLPGEMMVAISRLECQDKLEELRIRVGREVMVVVDGVESPLSLHPLLTAKDSHIAHILNATCGYSPYAVDDYLREGFLPMTGGHRLGICGTAVMDGGHISTMKDITSINVRIAKPWTGCGQDLAEQITGSTLLLGPPASGKTTLLRDLIRILSNRGNRMAVCDSRGELWAGGAMDLGIHTDVLSLAPKAKAMEILLRVMNPHWIVVDEITAPEDVEAMVKASYCGVKLLATAHGFGEEDLTRRPLYRQLLESQIFEDLVILDCKKNWSLQSFDFSLYKDTHPQRRGRCPHRPTDCNIPRFTET